MAIDYVNEDYTISLYSYNKNQHKTLVASYISTSSVKEEVETQAILNNYTWIKATGSSIAGWAIVSGGDNITTFNSGAGGSLAGATEIGTRVEIRENEIFTNVFRNASDEKHNGIAIYKSSSGGWQLNDYINVPTSSVSNGNAGGLAAEFSLHENYLSVTALDFNDDDSKLYIYKSSSNGWGIDAVLTTGSYNAGAAANDTHGDYAYLNSRIHGNKIFANGFLAGSDRFVAFFNSSSANGWQLEKEVPVAAVNSDTNASLGISGVAFDFDGTTAVMGSKDGESGAYYEAAAGKIHIFASSSTGWAEVAKLGLSGSGITSSVTNLFDTVYGASEYRTWSRFGYKSCTVSGSYIAASAQGQNVNWSGGGYRRQRHSVFIYKSSSNGWNIEARLNDPATNITVSASNSGDTNDTEFGTGILIRDNVLVVNSPEWKSDWSSAVAQGRTYVYVSTSAGGWVLNQTIDNPYSGSSFHGGTSYNKNMGFSTQGGYPNAGALSYGARPAISGNLLVLNGPSFNRHTDDSTTICGAVIPLVGSGSYFNQETTTYITESITTRVLSSSANGSPPFRLATNTIQNIRKQDTGNSYKTFIGEQKT